MKKIIGAAISACVIGAGVTYAALDHERKEVLSTMMEVQKDSELVQSELLGYTKYTDYLTAGKQIVSNEMKLLAVKVVREGDLVENIHKEVMKISSEATVHVHYSAEYSFGFDLKPENFDIVATSRGIEIKLNKPVLVASPAVTPLSHEIPSKGLLTDEKTAIIYIHQRLPKIALKQGHAMAEEEPIRALCEKRLIEFLQNFLAKQPGVKQVPTITVSYKGK